MSMFPSLRSSNCSKVALYKQELCLGCSDFCVGTGPAVVAYVLVLPVYQVRSVMVYLVGVVANLFVNRAPLGANPLFSYSHTSSLLA